MDIMLHTWQFLIWHQLVGILKLLLLILRVKISSDGLKCHIIAKMFWPKSPIIAMIIFNAEVSARFCVVRAKFSVLRQCHQPESV